MTKEELNKLSPAELAEHYSRREEEKFAEHANKIANKADASEIEKVKSEIKALYKEEIKSVKSALETLQKENETNKSVLKEQGKRLKTFKEEASEIDFKNPIKNQIAKATAALLSSPEFSEMAQSDFRGKTKGYSEKAVVNISTGHTGDNLLADIRDRVRNDDDVIMPHMYDFVPKETTDGTNIVFPQVYSLTDAFIGASAMYAENAEITDLEFKTKEVTASVKRIGNGMLLSKRNLKNNGTRWVQSYILNRMPNQMLTKLDFQMLFGSGSGDNLDGLTGDAQSFDISGETFSAGDITAVTDHADGLVKLTFGAAHGLRNGDSLTIAGSTNYNATYDSVIVTSETEVLIEATYVSESTSAWTATSKNPWYQAVDGVTVYDIAIAASSIMQARGFNPTIIVVNPNDVGKMSLTKDTTERYVDEPRNASQNLRINGLPVLPLQTMPAGKMLVGNMREIGLAEFTPMQISASESTVEKRKNEVAFIGEMELIFPIYNPYAFMYVDVADAKTALETV